MTLNKHFSSLIQFLNIFVLIIFITLPLQAGLKTAKGIVFEDSNQNGIMDNSEKGIPNVAVSNQSEVILTDQNGIFRLKVGKEAVIFVSKPADYQFPMNENHFPRFFYIHQPEGSPAGLKYPGISPTGKLPRTLYFPLIKSQKQDSFSVIITGDPQTQTKEEVNYFRDDVITQMMGVKADFYLALGDIVYNYLDIFEPMNQLVGKLNMPIYHVMGNHDMNFTVPDYHHQAETFKRIYGPEYYSFNYGNVHFIILNTVQYSGWNKAENKSGPYIGNIHQRQLNWLKNDLSVVPEDKLLVLTMHIPIDSAFAESDYNRIVNRKELYELLSNRTHLLALAGHMHFFEYMELNETHGWTGSARFPLLIAGAACGTWWHGPKDPNGIPYGMCTDGTPNGFFRFDFTGNTYSYEFIPCGPVENPHMRINSPFGSLSNQQLSEISIDVNVFTGTPDTTVTYRLDDREETPLKRTIKTDPFFTRLIDQNKNSYKNWMEPTQTAHTWTAPLPTNLEPGLHRLIISVKDQLDNHFTGYRIFEVK